MREKKNRYDRWADGGHVQEDEEKCGGQSWLAKFDTMDLSDGRALIIGIFYNST